jgi:hypothetical protein
LEPDVAIVDDSNLAPEFAELVAKLARERGVALEDENLVSHEPFPRATKFPRFFRG